MARLITLTDMARDNDINLSDNTGGMYDPSGKTAYGSDGTKVGTVTSAMVDPSGGRIRYLIVDTGGWFFSKEVLFPVGMARIEDDGVYFDSLTKEQVKSMREYRMGEDVADEDMGREATMLTGRTETDRYVKPVDMGTLTAATGTATATDATRFNYRDDDIDDKLFKAPQRLQLLEERLNVTKTRERVGEVEVSKRVETHTEKVNVALDREEVVIERRAVTDGQAVSGAVLGSNETIKVELEAERANVSKQAFVVEEVEIGKRTQTETQVVTETIGKEVLEVGRNGQTVTDGTMNTTGTVKKDESLIDRTGDAVRNLADDATGKNKR